MIRVALVEDHAAIRQGLAALIDGTAGYRCVGAHADCESLLAGLAAQAPDVVLMDLGLPGMSGVEGVRRVRARRPQAAILILTVYDDPDRVFEALCAGASGYLVKTTPPARLLEAIREAREGGSPMSSHIARMVVERLQHGGEEEPPAAAVLTARERDILDGLAAGRTYQGIANHLHIAVDTVRFHIRNIYRKLEARTQSEAVAKALRRGLL